jgi:hypothetical protein
MTITTKQCEDGDMAAYTHPLFRHKSSKNQAMADYDSHAMTVTAYRRFDDLSARIGMRGSRR